ncbi:hypothetical protein SLS62_005200 [Diatrype stigma]|uniref:1-alkyl-2-acetylglycerophosphocholine esterase n=1 Tax=Diatrype stigma TaxID=117547 RepID=A0AAN9V3K7_9PEZI
MAQSLASEGYIVVTVDHPYDATVVEFNDGSFVRAANISTDDEKAMEQVVQVRASDISFVIDQLQNATVLRGPIENSGSRIDFDRILMYGHSLGGAASAATMLSDARIQGGVDLDGQYFSPEKEHGVFRPFLSVGRSDHRVEDPTWDEFYGNARGPIAEIAVAGNVHGSFTDYPTIVTALKLNLTGDAKANMQEFIGSGDWARMGSIVTNLVKAFGDFVFEHTVTRILRGVDVDFPEVSLVRSQQL